MLTHNTLIFQDVFTLHPHGALYWHAKSWLLLSDLHLGKAAHLRKAGLPLPEGHDDRTLARLDAVIAHFRPERVVIIGDLFHSAHNRAWEPFHAWCARQSAEIHLVLGNHDRLADRRYREAGITLHDEELIEPPFRFAHEPPEEDEQHPHHTVCGHLHPGVLLRGKGDQRLRLPCLLVGPQVTLLPAFGTNTGLHLVKPGSADRVFACAPASVVDVTGLTVPPVPST